MNILITCAGRRNYLVHYFKEELGDRGKVYAIDTDPTAPALQEADSAFIFPVINDESYLSELRAFCISHSIRIIISLNDLELPLLSSVKTDFESLGVKIIVSSPEFIDICFDKWKTIKFIKSVCLDYPKSYLSLEDVEHALARNQVFFPLIIKPRWGSASIGIEKIYELTELKYAYQMLRTKLPNTILHRWSSADYDQSILIQEYIDGDEYGVDVINDLEGNYVTTFVKRKIGMRAGETDRATTVDNPELRRIGEIIGNASRHVGNLDCDMFFQNGKYINLEMNPRFGGHYPFSHLAGANLPAAIISWVEGKSPDLKYFDLNYGITGAKCDSIIQIKDEKVFNENPEIEKKNNI